ncbi:MAG: di-trans,poly-cis-decaprenylcistransferase [Candidatus Pacebacteria bacterium]|nr:di-trans,poly-cis-decaprenylcistransferase [Candidatus Paceibacterota bacterium]
MESRAPTCVGIIMDGNRRWARVRDVPTLMGHTSGYEKLKETEGWCKEANVRHLAVYAFSTENWNRGAEEVGYLMDLMRTVLHDRLEKLQSPDVAVHIVGDCGRFPKDIQDLIAAVHSKNRADAEYHLWVCASYGGKSEILAAVNALIQEGVQEVTEECFTGALWTAAMPAPDIIVRTGGERRLSNFLMWHSGYSELFFLDTLWPDFSKEEFDGILAEFAERTRNYGR